MWRILSPQSSVLVTRMIISAFVEVLLPVLVVVACGYALRRVFPIDLRSLNRVSMYVLSPALIFTTLARIEVAGGERGTPLLQVLRMPQIYAALAGLLARAAGINLDGQGHDVITALFRGVALMSDAALPLLLLVLGMQLAQGVAVEQRGLTTL